MLLLSVLLVMVMPLQALAAPSVFIDNQPVTFDVPPVIDNSRTLVPLRTIFVSLGAAVEWDGPTQTVTATRASTSIVLTIGQTTAYVNGDAVILDVPARIIEGRTLVPLRFIGEALGADVEWDAATQTINIYSNSDFNDGFELSPDGTGIFRGIPWGQSIDQAVRMQGTPDYEGPEKDLYYLAYLNQAMGHYYNITLLYFFDQDKLILTAYDLEVNQDALLEEYERLVALMNLKYGPPDEELIIWANTEYKNDPDQWNLAIRSGDFRITTSWLSGDTVLGVLLCSQNGEGAVRILYGQWQQMEKNE